MIFSIKENKENEIQFRVCHYMYVFCIEYMKGTIVSQLIDIIDKGGINEQTKLLQKIWAFL